MKRLLFSLLASGLWLLPVSTLAQVYQGPVTIYPPVTPGDCVEFATPPQNTNGLVDAGSPCGGGSGSTDVSGTANQITVTGSAGGPYTLSIPSAFVPPGTVDGLTIVTTSGTITITGNKSVEFDNSITFTGTDSTSFAFPATSATVAGLSIAQTWSALQSFNNGDLGLNGSSSGTMKLEAPAAASTYVQTFPARNGTVVNGPASSTDGDCAQFSGTSGSLLADAGAACGSGGSSAFNALTSGTNTTAAMVVGSGATLGATGSGTITFTAGPLSGITGFGTGVASALADNVGSAGAPVVFNGAGGTPSSLTLTNATGLPYAGGGTGATSYTTNHIVLSGASAFASSALSDDGTNVYSSEPVDLKSESQATEVANESSTGTTNNKLAKLTGAPSTAVIAATTDVHGTIGIVIAGGGTTGTAIIAENGQAPCVFDGATTAGDYVTISTSSAGECHDAGAPAPASGQLIGKVQSTNGSGGTYSVFLFAPEVVSGGSGLLAGTSVTLKGPSQIYVCTSTCTVTLPVPQANYQFCIWNDTDVATVITLAALGSSSYYENTARTAYGTSGTGTLTSAGAVGDKICVVGRDTTHYQSVSYQGTWTAS